MANGQNNNKLIIFLVTLIALVILFLNSAFTVQQRQVAIIFQFGNPVRQNIQPGLNFKIPFIQNVVYFDQRVLVYDAPVSEILTLDKKNLIVDNYSRWRIADPLKFYKTLKTESGAIGRIHDTVYAEMRAALGQFTLTEIISTKRRTVMDLVAKRSEERLQDFGIKLLDVRIKRADLPEGNAKNVYGRMRAERERMAKQYRAEGLEASLRITTNTDRERDVLIAEATRNATKIRGLGDAEAIKIYAKSFNQDPDFYVFFKTMEAYKKGLSKNTKIVLTPENSFLKIFENK